MNMNYFDKACMLLLVIGGLNWGLVGIFDFNLVGMIFGSGFFARLIYTLVGVSAAYKLWRVFPEYCHTHHHPKPC